LSKIRELPEGQAVITTGGRLTAKYVIHTVGPVYCGGGPCEAEALASCHRESIRLADEHNLQSVTFPAISTGAFGYPPHEAAPIALSSTIGALRVARNLRLCRFVLFNKAMCDKFERAAEKLGRTDPSIHVEKANS
jgi:O-acetyl-ADP-ribose deacetylase (regulator of RNase III)